MKKVNFDKLKSVSTPDKWLDNAINISEKKNAIPFYKHTSFLVSVACVVLCMIVGVVMLFNAFPDKSSASDSLLSNITQPDNESITKTTSESPSNYNIMQSGLDDNTDNRTVTNTVSPFTEPSEKENKVSSEDTKGSFHTDGNNSVLDSTSPNSNGAGGNQSATSKANLSATDNLKETRPDDSNEISTFPESRPNTNPSVKPTHSVPQTTAPKGVYSNPIYLHIKIKSDFDYLNTVGCHLKEIGGEDLYKYKSDYEHCVVDMTVDDGFASLGDICITYQNNGPNEITFGLYEVTFYDVKGNTITKTISILNNNSVLVLYE